MKRRAGSALVAALLGVTVLLGLGAWQLYRLQWKEGLIAEMEARLSAPPVSLDEAIGDPAEFLHVRASGTFEHEGEMFVLDSQGGRPGWRVVTPLKSSRGIFVLVDRGFVPDEQRSPAKRPESQPQGNVEISGYLSRHAGGRGLFTPDNDAAGNNWYWWDVPAMLAFGKIDPSSRVAPFILHVLPGNNAGVLPKPSPPMQGLSNNHLQYALTWFGLAIVLAFVAFFYLRSEASNRT
jgi:surfeit locus 1 family protein